MTREEAEARAAARTECLNEELRAKDRARYAWERARYEERVREADEQYERERLERRRQGELEWRKRHGLDGLGSSPVEHTDAAVREITDGFEPFMEQAAAERTAGDCDSAADSLFAAARVFGGIKAHAQAAGAPFPQPQLVQLEIEVDHFVEKCVIKRRR